MPENHQSCHAREQPIEVYGRLVAKALREKERKKKRKRRWGKQERDRGEGSLPTGQGTAALRELLHAASPLPPPSHFVQRRQGVIEDRGEGRGGREVARGQDTGERERGVQEGRGTGSGRS